MHVMRMSSIAAPPSQSELPQVDVNAAENATDVPHWAGRIAHVAVWTADRLVADGPNCWELAPSFSVNFAVGSMVYVKQAPVASVVVQL